MNLDLKPGDLITGRSYSHDLADAIPIDVEFEIMGTETHEVIIHPSEPITILVWAPTLDIIEKWLFDLPPDIIKDYCERFKYAPPIMPKLKINQYMIMHIILSSVKKI